MVPFADQINHENVDTNYDCLDSVTGISFVSRDELDERRTKEEDEIKN